MVKRAIKLSAKNVVKPQLRIIYMKNKIFSAILNWLQSTEMFARPSKQIPGKWQLFEYYVENGSDLQNINEARLKEVKEFWDIEFSVENKYYHQCNLPIWQISKVDN